MLLLLKGPLRWTFFTFMKFLFLLKRSAVVHFKIYFCNVITTKKVRFGGTFYIYEILFLLKRSAVVHFFLHFCNFITTKKVRFGGTFYIS